MPSIFKAGGNSIQKRLAVTAFKTRWQTFSYDDVL
jgi:hypothetical protein